MKYGGTKLHIILRDIGYCIILAVGFILQDIFFSNMPIFGIKPLIMPVCCAAIALSEGMERGAAYGIAAGVLCDIAMSRPTIGFTLLLTLLGLGIGWLSERLVGRNYITFLLCTLAALSVCAFFQIFSLWAYKQVPLSALMRTVVLQTLYSLLFTIPLAPTVRRAAERGGHAA